MLLYIVAGALLGVPALAAVIASTVIAPAEARGLHPDCNITMPCTPVVSAKPSSPREARRIRAYRFRNVEFGSPMYPSETQRSFLNRQATILPHPPGCPRRAFCGWIKDKSRAWLLERDAAN